MMISDGGRWPIRLGQTALLGGTGLAALIDVFFGMQSGSGLTAVATLVYLAVAAVAMGIWLPGHRQGSRLLPILAVVLAVGSVLITGLVMFEAGNRGGLWGLAEASGLMLVVFAVARRAQAPLAFLAIGAGLFALTIQPLRTATGYQFLVLGLIQAIIGGVLAAIGFYLRLMQAQRDKQISMVRAEQRAEFARDLHDFIAHHVTGIVVQAQGARFIAEQDPQRVIVALDAIERAGAETMAAMRRMVGVLRQGDADTPLAPLAGVADLRPLIEQFGAAGGPRAILHVDGDLTDLPVDVSTSAYRVVMEALTNVRQHAPAAATVWVAVRRTPEWLFVRVTNDGVTPSPAPGDRRGYGLVGLGERVGAVGGWLRAGPGIDGGWVVDAALPLTVFATRGETVRGDRT